MKWFLMLLVSLMAAETVTARTVTLVACQTLPPYIMETDSNSDGYNSRSISDSGTSAGSGRGMEYDIVREVLARQGHGLVLKFVSFDEISPGYRKYDGAMTMDASWELAGFYSDVVVTYRYCAFSLKEKQIRVDTIRDLSDKRIVAFRNATRYLGWPFYRAVANNPEYREQGKQDLRIKMLYSGRPDVIVSDRLMFSHYMRHKTRIDTSADVVVHEIFEPGDYRVLFTDGFMRDRFNAGLHHLRKTGQYKAIMNAYMK